MMLFKILLHKPSRKALYAFLERVDEITRDGVLAFEEQQRLLSEATAYARVRMAKQAKP